MDFLDGHVAWSIRQPSYIVNIASCFVLGIVAIVLFADAELHVENGMD